MASHSTHGPEWVDFLPNCCVNRVWDKAHFPMESRIEYSLGQLWPERFLLIFGESKALNLLWRMKSTNDQSCRCVYIKFPATGTDVTGII